MPAANCGDTPERLEHLPYALARADEIGDYDDVAHTAGAHGVWSGVVQDTVPMQALVSRDEICDRPFAADFLVVRAENDRRHADAGGAPFVATRKKWKNFLANDSKYLILGIAGLYSAFSEQSDWPILIALFSAYRSLVQQQAQSSIKYVVTYKHNGIC